MGSPGQDFVAIFRVIWRLLRWASLGIIVLVLLMFAAEVRNLYGLFSAVHPAAGWAFLVFTAALAWWLVGVPIMRFMRMPVAVKPPPLPRREEGLATSHLTRHLDHVAKYVRLQRRNPMMAEHRGQIDEAVGECEALRSRVAERGDAGLDESLREISAFETGRVDALLRPLDRQADQMIRQEALGVGVATAVSMNGTLDAFIVLWRNINMISRIAHLYHGRPGPRASLLILRDVMVTVFISSKLENVTDFAGGLMGKWFGGVASVVAGPLLNGGANALMTLRIGYLAKARCRSFQAWTEEHRRSVLIRCLKIAKDASADVLAEIAAQVGGIVGGAGATLYRGAKGTIRGVKDLFTGRWFGPGPGPDEEPSI